MSILRLARGDLVKIKLNLFYYGFDHPFDPFQKKNRRSRHMNALCIYQQGSLLALILFLMLNIDIVVETEDSKVVIVGGQ